MNLAAAPTISIRYAKLVRARAMMPAASLWYHRDGLMSSGRCRRLSRQSSGPEPNAVVFGVDRISAVRKECK